MNLLRRKSWSPYVVGATIGVLSWFSFATADRLDGAWVIGVAVVLGAVVSLLHNRTDGESRGAA